MDQADLVVANNVLADVSDINNFVAGIALLLKPNGRVSIEFPNFLRLLSGNQFDIIYHEIYSYLSLHVVRHISQLVGLYVVDVQLVPTNGGSLRVWLAHQGKEKATISMDSLLAAKALSAWKICRPM